MQEDRPPIRSYEQALWRLTQAEVSERYTGAQLDLAVELVADVFWVSDKKVRHDLEKRVRGVVRDTLPAKAAPRHIRGVA